MRRAIEKETEGDFSLFNAPMIARKRPGVADPLTLSRIYKIGCDG